MHSHWRARKWRSNVIESLDDGKSANKIIESLASRDELTGRASSRPAATKSNRVANYKVHFQVSRLARRSARKFDFRDGRNFGTPIVPTTFFSLLTTHPLSGAEIVLAPSTMSRPGCSSGFWTAPGSISAQSVNAQLGVINVYFAVKFHSSREDNNRF